MSAVEAIDAPAPNSSSADQRRLLGKMFGALGSVHEGERAAALAAIDKTMQSGGTSWADVANAIAGPPDWQDIDGAPRDGTLVLLRVEIGLPQRIDLRGIEPPPPKRSRFVVARWTAGRWANGDLSVDGDPTDFLPIPTPSATLP